MGKVNDADGGSTKESRSHDQIRHMLKGVSVPLRRHYSSK